MRQQDVVTDPGLSELGPPLDSVAEPPAGVDPAPATSCPTCGEHFASDGQFCPLDGTALVPATGWRPTPDTLIGSVVDGRYEVLSVLGEGGMGTVYEVRHRALGKRFALKALRKELARDTEISARFIQEARTAAAVSHPGLVEITDFGQTESGQVYFVMELLEGQSLAALLRAGGPIPAARGLRIVRQLAHAIKAAHDASIVHRDLKPDNIHIGRGDHDADLVKVVDFGLAKVIGTSKLTRGGMVFGTPHYMSPEQATGEPVDHRADIYALGIVMYEMFTGKVPFEADSYMGVLTKHMYMTPPPPSTLRPEMKTLGTLEAVILRCLEKRPEARYPSLAELLTDLDQRLPSGAGKTPLAGAPFTSLLADELELPLDDEGALQPKARGWAALALALVVLAGVVLVVALRRGTPSEPARAAAAPTAAVAPVQRTVTEAAIEAPSISVVPTQTAAALASTPPAPAHKPVVGTSRKPPALKPKGSGPTGKRAPGSGEIVDPWAR